MSDSARGHEAGRTLARAALVPIGVAALTLSAMTAAHVDPGFVLRETVLRFGRNAVLVLALVLPIRAGLGLNFGIVVGAMAGQMGLLAALCAGAEGPLGLLAAFALSTPIAVLFGCVLGALLDRVRGREMVTALVAAFFANGLYQLFFLFAAGTLFPVPRALLLPSGRGLRNTIDLTPVHHGMDHVLSFTMRLGGAPLRVPVFTLMAVLAVAAVHLHIGRTRLGRAIRAVGVDAPTAAAVGIDVSRVRMVATALSTVVAAWGQILSLQDLGTLNTYNAHEQIATFAIAALLLSGATVRRAGIGEALLGTLLFHALFVVAPLAGKELAGDAQVGEYLRSFLAYAVICAALAFHAESARSTRA